jgi:hypothetical protein
VLLPVVRLGVLLLSRHRRSSNLKVVVADEENGRCVIFSLLLVDVVTVTGIVVKLVATAALAMMTKNITDFVMVVQWLVLVILLSVGVALRVLLSLLSEVRGVECIMALGIVNIAFYL